MGHHPRCERAKNGIGPLCNLFTQCLPFQVVEANWQMIAMPFNRSKWQNNRRPLRDSTFQFGWEKLFKLVKWHVKTSPIELDNGADGVRRAFFPEQTWKLVQADRTAQQFVKLELTVQIPVHKQRKVYRWTT